MRQAGWVSSISAPLLSPGEGFLEPGASVRIAKKSIFTGGQPYYTTDGSDPRLPGGEINPVAEEGPTELSLEQSGTIKARMRNNSGWGPLTEGHYHFGQPGRP